MLTINRIVPDRFSPNRVWIRHAVFGGLLLVLCCPVYSVEPREGEAIVLLRVRDYVGSNQLIKRLTFRNIETNRRFKIDVEKYFPLVRDFPKRAPAGTYYLERLHWIFAGGASITLPQPKTKLGLIILEAGSITYIGEWHLHQSDRGSLRFPQGGLVKERGFYKEVTYSADSLQRFRDEHPELVNYPLRLSKETGELYQGDWQDLAEHTEAAND